MRRGPSCAVSFITALGLSFSVFGCSKQSAEPQHGVISSRSVATSTEWEACEHSVPVEVCVKCNPDLEKEFKRVGDWCPPHDVAESQCFECNPDLTFSPPTEPPEGSDVTQIASGAETLAKLEPHLAEGKITVFDFYAAWCQPCHKVNDHLYAKLARGQDFAIRKIDVGSWESEVAEQGLEDVPELPYLVFYDARGRKIAEISGAKFDEIDDALSRSGRK
jgi:thiol-disulfide isomerase/thioredoxin